MLEDISNLTVAKATVSQSKKDKHIESLENKVDTLELEVASLKKKLALKPIDTNKDYKAMYEKILPELQEYWKDTTPF